MDKFLETYNLSTLNHEEIENLNRLQVGWISNQKNPHKQKSITRWLYWWILPNIQRRIDTNISQTLSKSRRGGNTFKLILWSQHCPDIKTRQGHYKKRKLQTHIFNEHSCRKPQQISKLNSTVHHTSHILWSRGFISEMQGWFKICKSINVITLH